MFPCLFCFPRFSVFWSAVFHCLSFFTFFRLLCFLKVVSRTVWSTYISVTDRVKEAERSKEVLIALQPSGRILRASSSELFTVLIESTFASSCNPKRNWCTTRWRQRCKFEHLIYPQEHQLFVFWIKTYACQRVYMDRFISCIIRVVSTLKFSYSLLQCSLDCLCVLVVSWYHDVRLRRYTTFPSNLPKLVTLESIFKSFDEP